MSYAELDAVSDSVATSLRARGVARGDVVGVLLPRSVEMVACWLGILKAGATYLPLDPSYPASRLHFMLSDSDARAVLVAGLSVIDQSLLNGLLVPTPDTVLFGLITDDAGALHIDIPWPASLVAPAQLIVQIWILEPTTASGYVSTNALALNPL